MDATAADGDIGHSPVRVSVITRLVAAVAYSVPAIGGALGSLLLMNMFRALRLNENAGTVVVMKAMNETSLPVIVSLYLAAVLAIVVIIVLVVRTFVQTKTASPPFWFFAIGGILCLLPAALFWKAQMLIIDVLSPGSSVGAGGISAAANELSTLLWLSVIAAPVVFIVLVVLSVLPFSSRPGPKWGSLVVTTAIAIVLVATAVAVPFLIGEPKRKNEMVSLPADIKNADRDSDVEKDTAMVLTLSADNKIYQRKSLDLPGKTERTEAAITQEELSAKIRSSMEGKTPDKRIVYFKCDINAGYENVVKVFDAIRKADVDKVGLVVVGKKNYDDPYQVAALRFEVRLPEAPNINVSLRPNPLMLVAALGNDGKLLLNNDDAGTVSDPAKLENKLREIFKERENNGLFREGTNEIEKTVFIKAPKSSKYGDFIKLVEAVKGSGASPVGIAMEEVPLRKMEIVR